MPLLRKLTALAGAAAAARNYARKNPEKVNRMAQKAAQFVDQRTKGKYRTQIDGVVRKVRTTTDGRGKY
ncbi:MAG: antitoxin [Actinomycetota bacterium]|nr:antitoxin [Actinomycetota bacterium]